ncbi:hypothetical protein C2I33_06750 [Ralstonia solanacearum]|nr:hypothetical protein C2I33_06750 [Ralstonia solanacearum]
MFLSGFGCRVPPGGPTGFAGFVSRRKPLGCADVPMPHGGEPFGPHGAAPRPVRGFPWFGNLASSQPQSFSMEDQSQLCCAVDEEASRHPKCIGRRIDGDAVRTRPQGGSPMRLLNRLSGVLSWPAPRIGAPGKPMRLHATNITFDEVSQVVYAGDRKRPYTAFNFVSNGKPEYAVSIDGKVSIRRGMTVTALLREPGNWQTLVGWMDHGTGRICGVRSPVAAFWEAMVFLSAIALVVAMSSPLIGSGAWPRSTDYWMLAIYGFGVAIHLCVLRRSRLIIQRLRQSAPARED